MGALAFGAYGFQKYASQGEHISINEQNIVAPGDTIVFGTYLNEPIE